MILPTVSVIDFIPEMCVRCKSALLSDHCCLLLMWAHTEKTCSLFSVALNSKPSASSGTELKRQWCDNMGGKHCLREALSVSITLWCSLSQPFSLYPSSYHFWMWIFHKKGVLLLSCVRLFAVLWTVVHQAPLFMELSRQEYWSGLLFPPPGDLPDPGIKPRSPALQANSLPSELPGPSQVAQW